MSRRPANPVPPRKRRRLADMEAEAFADPPRNGEGDRAQRGGGAETCAPPAGLTFLPPAALAVSPLNVRTSAEDAEATDALQASIARWGLFKPLLVHSLVAGGQQPTPPADPGAGLAVGGPPPKYGVFAGGRRLRAIHALVAAGRLPPDWPVPVFVRDGSEADLTEMSLGENLHRELRPHEVAAGIAHAATKGASVAEIAANLGQREVVVRRHLRLGRLDGQVFAAFAAGRLSLDQASAYAATEDAALQRAAFAHFAARHAWDHTPEAIRRWLKVGDRELERLLAFVGPEAYRAAGGRFELDLFADGPERGRVADEGLLRELAEAKLVALRETIRVREGRPGLRFAAEPPKFNGYADFTLRLELSSARRRKLHDDALVAVLSLADDGGHELAWWWTSRKAKREAERAAAPAADGEGAPQAPARAYSETAGLDAGNNADLGRGFQQARAAVRDQHGLSDHGLQVLRSLRREILRALLCIDAESGGTLGRDYLVWAQLRHELSRDRDTATGARSLASEPWTAAEREPAEVVADWLDETGSGGGGGGAGPAHALWREALAEVAAHPAFADPDPSAGFAAFLGEDGDQADEAFRTRAGAVLAGLALLRSANVAGWRIPVHDRLAALAGGGSAEIVRQLWRPTPAFLGLLPKLRRLDLVEQAGAADHPTVTRWSKLKDRELSREAAAALAARDDWLHPLLAFDPVPPQPVPAEAGREGDHAQHGGGAEVASASDEESGCPAPAAEEAAALAPAELAG